VADAAAQGHGVHDVYTQAPVLDVYRRTGKLPDGTVKVLVEGQQRAMRAMKPGRDGKEIHDSLTAFFTEQGYPT
jgi:acylphosphatase